MSRDGLITVGEIKQLIESVGGKMTEGEARALVRQVLRGRESGKRRGPQYRFQLSNKNMTF